MPITSSTFTLGLIQVDGRRWCVESHIAGSGVVHRSEYLAAATTDYITVMGARATALTAQLKEDELAFAASDAPWDFVLQEATNTELSAYIRGLYKNSSRERLAKIASRVLEWVVNGRFTDNQVRAAFGLTNTQWTALKTKMQTLVTNHASVNLAVGE